MLVILSYPRLSPVIPSVCHPEFVPGTKDIPRRPQKVRKMTIVGSKKMIIYDDIKDNKITIYDKGIDKIAVLGKNMDFDDPNNFNFDYRIGEALNPRITYKEPLKEEIDHFVDCIITSKECITGIGHARTVIEILEKSSSQDINEKVYT